MTIDEARPWSRPTVQRRPRRRRPLLAFALLTVTLLLAVTVRALTADGDGERQPVAGCHAEVCTGEAGPTGGEIGRTEIAARARTWLGNISVPYSMTGGHAGPGGWRWYRRDCSGFVSMALRLPDDDGGASTVGLADVVRKVRADELRPYDLIGTLGHGTGGASGHVQFFLGWADTARTRVRVMEQGSLDDRAPWPHEATYDWPERMADGTALRAYRYTGVRD